MTTPSMRPMTAVTAALCIGAAAVLTPLWAPLVLAAWFADLLQPAVGRLERLLGGRRRAAGALIVLVVVGVLLPVVGIAAALTTAVRELLAQVRAAMEGQGSLAGALLAGGSAVGRPEMHDWVDLASRYGTNAWGALLAVGRASASAAIGTLVFVAALYTFAVDGGRFYAWLERHAPITRAELGRLAAAFRETGRGLIVAGGGTALLQGALATAAYLAIGIPRAIILGPLTAVCALVPFVGTGLVWLPLAIELVASGQYWRAGVVVAMGVGVHSLVDNFVRPMLARHGHLRLHTFVVLVSMLGGVALFGATGALLGPLMVRLCVESLAIASERRRVGLSQVEAGSVPCSADAPAQGRIVGLPSPADQNVRPIV
jgi:predicted PurR-regulated permease PerM